MNKDKKTALQRLDERICIMEKAIRKLDPGNLLERVAALETGDASNITFSADAACRYLNMKKSMLYKLTSAKEIPYYKPEGKRIYFVRAELDKWMQRNPSPTVDEMMRRSQEYMANRKKGPNNKQ